MLFLIVITLQGASVMELFQVGLVVSQILAESALVQMIRWYATEKWGSQISLVACEDCLDVCLWDQWQKVSVYGAL